MKNLLFAALLLGCFLCHVSGQNGIFEFYDDQGNCWRCTPGNTCERCGSTGITIPRVNPIEWPEVCPAQVDCQQLIKSDTSLSVKYPAIDSRNYIVCRPDPAGSGRWVAEERACPCETLFSYIRQRCDWPHDWQPYCTNLKTPVEVEDCPTATDTTIETTLSTPTDPTPDDRNSTQAPCMCIPWWPCWCNPCWQMPCGSCSGCVGK